MAKLIIGKEVELAVEIPEVSNNIVYKKEDKSVLSDESHSSLTYDMELYISVLNETKKDLKKVEDHVSQLIEESKQHKKDILDLADMINNSLCSDPVVSDSNQPVIEKVIEKEIVQVLDTEDIKNIYSKLEIYNKRLDKVSDRLYSFEQKLSLDQQENIQYNETVDNLVKFNKLLFFGLSVSILLHLFL